MERIKNAFKRIIRAFKWHWKDIVLKAIAVICIIYMVAFVIVVCLFVACGIESLIGRL